MALNKKLLISFSICLFVCFAVVCSYAISYNGVTIPNFGGAWYSQYAPKEEANVAGFNDYYSGAYRISTCLVDVSSYASKYAEEDANVFSHL